MRDTIESSRYKLRFRQGARKVPRQLAQSTSKGALVVALNRRGLLALVSIEGQQGESRICICQLSAVANQTIAPQELRRFASDFGRRIRSQVIAMRRS